MSFDPSNYDAMMTYMKTMFEMAESMPDLKRGRLVRVADNRIIGTTGYTNKEAADAGAEQARPAMAGLAEFMTEAPILRKGEIVWAFDSDDQSKPTGYVRHTGVSFALSKFDTMISFFDGITEKFRGVPGLVRVRVARVFEDRIIGTSAFEDKASADKAVQEHRGLMAGMAEFSSGAPNIREGEVIWSHDK
jgi:hypothetical protein